MRQPTGSSCAAFLSILLVQGALLNCTVDSALSSSHDAGGSAGDAGSGSVENVSGTGSIRDAGAEDSAQGGRSVGGNGGANSGSAGADEHGGADQSGGTNGIAGAGGSEDTEPPNLTLTSTGFLEQDGKLIFPKSASYPEDQSPPFAWSGAPSETKSFVLTFVDKSNGATKWVVWDIPKTVTSLPGNMSKTVHPTEVPEATQRGSLGRTGYSGPGVKGPPMHTYEFVLWAMNVANLPGTDGLSTVDIRQKILPKYEITRSAPLVALGQLGGP